MMAATKETRCSIPFDRSSQRVFSTPSSPTRASSRTAREAASASPTPFSCAMYDRKSATRILR